MNSERSALRLGTVGRAHGLRGEVEVRLEWEHSQTLREVSEVLLVNPAGEKRLMRVRGWRRGPKAGLLKLEGVDDRTQAELLGGSVLWVRREALPPLALGEYYLADLLGMTVTAGGEPVGKVVDVVVYPSVDVAVVELAQGQLREQPLIAPWLSRVRLDEGIVELSSVEGMIDTQTGDEDSARR